VQHTEVRNIRHGNSDFRIFIDEQTKLWGTYHTRAAQGLEESLKNLGLEYVDCKACPLTSTYDKYI
jgi:diketogulonate reductase-like aldo/keto reductase